MYYSRTDRHERTWPAERPFARRNMPKKYWHVFGETAPPSSVGHRSALAARDDNGAAYARELLSGEAGAVAPPRARRATEVTRIPRRPLTPQQEREALLKELAKANAAIERAKATLASLNK